jgi:hypothetical protein
MDPSQAKPATTEPAGGQVLFNIGSHVQQKTQAAP